MSSASNMRHCASCHALFNDRERFKGLCPASGGPHRSDGHFNYTLFFGMPDNFQLQGAWRPCDRCQAIYFDGYPDKKTCDAGDGHRPNPVFPQFNFMLPHEIQATTDREPGWEYCTKCQVLFLNRENESSHCAAGGNHELNPGAFHFVLSHGSHPPGPPVPID